MEQIAWLAVSCLLLAGLAGCTVPEGPNATTAPGAGQDGGGEAEADAGNGTGAGEDSEDAGTGDDTDAGPAVIAFTDVGQGDGIVIRFPDAVVVIDAGRNSDGSNDAVTDYLVQHGVSVVDRFVVTHADADHSGGCDDVFEEFEVRAFYHPGAQKDTVTWQECLDAAAAEGSTTYTDADLNPGDDLAWSKHADVRLVHIDATASDANAGSLAVRIDHGDASALLVGDLTCDAEDEILIRFSASDLDVDLLQAGHHGSRYSTCTPWLEATTPALAAISVGENGYGHPHIDALSRLDEAGAEIYTTQDHGLVEFTSDGAAWSVTTETDAPPLTLEPEPEPDPEPEPEAELAVTASVSDSMPCQYSTVHVYVHAEHEGGEPAAGADVHTAWHYKSTTSTEDGTTDGNGDATLSRSISRASTTHAVTIDVTVTLDGVQGTAQTSFTPEACS